MDLMRNRKLGDDMSKDLIEAMSELNEKQIMGLIEDQLETRDPMEILEDLKEGLARVGELFEAEAYFLSDLVFASEIFKEIMHKLAPHFPKQDDEDKGIIVMGTVQGDFHDIGKNIMADLLRFNGYQVEDLGVDVPPEKFLEAIKKFHPDILGLTGLLTAAFEPMKKTIQLVRHLYKSGIIIAVGGAPINEKWIKDVGADFGANNASIGIKLIDEKMSKRKKISID